MNIIVNKQQARASAIGVSSPVHLNRKQLRVGEVKSSHALFAIKINYCRVPGLARFFQNSSRGNGVARVFGSINARRVPRERGRDASASLDARRERDLLPSPRRCFFSPDVNATFIVTPPRRFALSSLAVET